MKVLRRIIYPLAILAFVANILYVWNSEAMRASWMGNDEYFFYRITQNLPNYETTGVWLIEEGAPNPEGVDDAAVYLFDRAYTTPIWIHPLVANFIAYPIAMAFDDAPQQIQWLRLVEVFIIILTVVLFLEVIRRRTNTIVAAISVLPMLFGRLLLANGIIFYNDLFMWLFFALTMFVITVRPRSGWIILLAAVTVLCKQNAPLLLAPILLYLYYQTRDKKALLRVGIVSSLLVIGYMAFQAVVASDPLYFINHWGRLNPQSKLNITRNVLPYLWTYVISWGLWVTIPLLVVGIALIIKRKIIAFYGFAAFGLVTLLYGFGWGSYAYQVYPVMYSSMFMVPAIWFKPQIKMV
ncbi:MAG: hypothetical protein V3U84_12315 [Thiotrichaceae bacterium]